MGFSTPKQHKLSKKCNKLRYNDEVLRKRWIVEDINNWLSLFGNITSIIGFFMTIAVFFGVRSLKNFYVAKATIPHQLEELEGYRETIEELLSGRFSAANRDKAIELSSAAKVSIKNLQPKLKGIDKSQYKKQIDPNVKNFLQAIDLFIEESSKENARNMNRRLYEFLRSSELVINDDNWRRTQ